MLPGMLRLEATFPTAEPFLAAVDTELSKKGLLVRGAEAPGATPMSECTVVLRVGAGAPLELPARIAAVIPELGVAVLFDAVPPAVVALAQSLRSGGAAPTEASPPADAAPSEADAQDDEPAAHGPIADRLRAMTVAEKMALAVSSSADRETRAALLRDTNKVLHLFVFKNPRIGLDEVQAAAKLPALSPDALKFIAEHREWGLNGSVCTALVRNPRLPMPIALRLIDRLPSAEIRALAKGGARDPIVQACRKRVAG